MSGAIRGVCLEDTTVLRMSPKCVIRLQEDAYLCYNRATDELHLISLLGHYILRLCTGLSTVGDTERVLLAIVPDSARAEFQGSVRAFLDGLLDRGLVEPIDA